MGCVEWLALPWALHFKVGDQGQTCACHVVNDNSCSLRLWLLKQREKSSTMELWKFSRLMNPRYAACERVGKQGGHYVIQEEVRALSTTVNATEECVCGGGGEWVRKCKTDEEKDSGMGRRFIWFGGDLAATHNMGAMLNGSSPNGYETAHAHTSH